MKKFINQGADYVDEMLAGIYQAHSQAVHSVGNDLRCYALRKKKQGQVAIITGGGSGHLPLFLGYVGDGLLDGCAVGGVFQSPSVEQIYQLTEKVHAGAGVFYLYGNYTGDVLNFDMAAELAAESGIDVLSLQGNDDVLSAPKGEEHNRRGIAGIVFLYKIAGAAAAAGYSLAEVARISAHANSRLRTVGVALSPCVMPESGRSSFQLGAEEMEVGMGIHGEPGIRRGKLLDVESLLDEILPPLQEELDLQSGDRLAVLVNSLGATPLDELYILFNSLSARLKKQGLGFPHVKIGPLVTSMEMMGMSLSLLKLDDELERLYAEPAQSPFVNFGNMA